MGAPQGGHALVAREVVDVVVQGEEVELRLDVQGAQIGLPGLDAVGEPTRPCCAPVGHVLLEVDRQGRQAGVEAGGVADVGAAAAADLEQAYR